jgi:hypothetical protein
MSRVYEPLNMSTAKWQKIPPIVVYVDSLLPSQCFLFSDKLPKVHSKLPKPLIMYSDITKQISHIIERTRQQEESFLPDSALAARKIIEYLQNEDVLSKTEVVKLSKIEYGKAEVAY